MIKINHLSKIFGKTKVLDDINLELKPNEVYCLLGKNGAGKTTLISLILDLVELTEGEISIFDKAHDSLSAEDKNRIGVAIENLALIEEISGYDYLTFVGKMYKVPKAILEQRIADLFRYFFENESDIDKNIGKYSTGMKKKIAFCAAVIHTPDLLVLDEPFSGLDPLVANQMVLFLKKYQNEQRSIFISSHDLGYVQKIATQIGVLDETKLVYNSSLQNFTEEGEQALDAALLKILHPNEAELDKIDWI
ncbi:MAG: ABC transporter ATP-binding protein [Crocinitomicaceae bacterium]